MREGFFRSSGGGRPPGPPPPPPELRAFARDPWSLFALWNVHPRLRPGRYAPQSAVQLQLVLLDREGTRLAAQDVMPSGGHYFAGLVPGQTYSVELWWRAEGEVPEPLPLPPRAVTLPSDRPAPPSDEVQLLRLPWGAPLAAAAAQLRGEPPPAAPQEEGTEAAALRPGGPGEGLPEALRLGRLPGSDAFGQLPSSATAGLRLTPGSASFLPSSAERPSFARMPGSSDVPGMRWLPSSGALAAPAVRGVPSSEASPRVTLREVLSAPASLAPARLPGSAEVAGLRVVPGGLPGSASLAPGQTAWHPPPGSGDLPRGGLGVPGAGTLAGLEGQWLHVTALPGLSSGDAVPPPPRTWVTWVPAPSPVSAPAPVSPAPTAAGPGAGAGGVPAAGTAGPTPSQGPGAPAPGAPPGRTPAPPAAPAPPPPAAPERAPAVAADFFGRWRSPAAPVPRGPRAPPKKSDGE